MVGESRERIMTDRASHFEAAKQLKVRDGSNITYCDRDVYFIRLQARKATDNLQCLWTLLSKK